MKIKFLSLIALAAIAFSCSDDDDSSSNSTNHAGTYFLTAFTIAEPQDLNGDGTSSSNILNETDCFEGGFIQLNSDNTFTASSEGMDITLTNEGVEVVECYDDGNFSGTWSASGNQITMTYSSDGDMYTDTFNISNNSITYTVEDGEVVGMSGGNPVYITTDISIVYTKQ